jgi:selenocysteine lyase/cysteine desulfurase
MLLLLQVQADFVPISFYKMFGYPSGLGALLVRKQAAAALRKVYFGGGSVDWCTAEDAWHVLSALPAGEQDRNCAQIASLLAALSTAGCKAPPQHVLV